MNTPVVFLSYASRDEKSGDLKQFRSRLKAELEVITGDEVPVLHQTHDKEWERRWREWFDTKSRVPAAFIPIITPSYFRSEQCRDELNRFMKREREWGRTDLIFPVYYVTSVELEQGTEQQDSLVTTIRSRQYIDWRNLRFEEFKSPSALRTLSLLAVQIRDALSGGEQPERREPRSDATTFDVFLCYNSQDGSEVRAIAEELRNRHIKPWIDYEQLRPGYPWQGELQRELENIRAAAIFMGKSGHGPWQDLEVERVILEFIRRGRPVIPVILPDTKRTPGLPAFLGTVASVDMRSMKGKAIEQLIWGITGQQPTVP